MQVTFLDTIGWDYDVATPTERPLGGSQSALCYLAAALVRRGHGVVTYTGTSRPRDVFGVRCLSFTGHQAELLAEGNWPLVVLNGPADMAVVLRRHLPADRPLILWTQHAHDQAAMRPLTDPQVRAAWSRVVCVSHWQREQFCRSFGFQPRQIDVQRNAVSPAFLNLFADAADLRRAKQAQLRLAYTSTPFRGLRELLSIFPELLAQVPDCRLQVFSSMQVYQQAPHEDVYTLLYGICQSMAGVDYFGGLDQPRLAQMLRGATLLAYPNTFAETSCIAVMEALAAGMHVVSSRLGALPETGLGLATLIAPDESGRPGSGYLHQFVAALAEQMSRCRQQPEAYYDALWQQVCQVNRQYTWDRRAEEWEPTLSGGQVVDG